MTEEGTRRVDCFWESGRWFGHVGKGGVGVVEQRCEQNSGIE